MGLQAERRRLLQQTLEDILGSKNVYYQPPPSIKMKYPAIVYYRNVGNTDFADNNPYSVKVQYKVILIDRNPDTPFLEKISELPMCLYDRFYTADNLNHDVFNLYF